MLHILLIASLASLSPSALAQVPQSLTEDEAMGLRQMYGIQDLRSDDDASYFAFQDKGNFLISRANFSSLREAAAFCSSKQGFSLTNGALPSILTMMGAPFVDLLQRISVNSPVLGNGRTGVAFWVNFDTSQIHDEQELSDDEREILEMIRAGDAFFAWTDGDGGNGSGPHRTSEINARLLALGEGPLSSPAFCVDEALRTMELRP